MAYKIFRVPVGYRLYDREKNKVIALHEEEYRALDHIARGIGAEEDYKLLQMIQERGYCCENSLQEVEHPLIHTVESVISESVGNLLLQVTQNCNLRCSYCGFSGNYYNRQHNGKRMTVDIAFRAVDFLFTHSSKVERVVIGFYGGEPLLEFPLIKKVVAYVENTYPERDVLFNLTTNLTLFTDEVIDYMIDKEFQILISIDGPEEIQDKYRIFSSGKGSFAVVTDNAKKIREKNPAYFRKCETNTVISPDEDYDRIREFLDKDEVFGELGSMISEISDSGIKSEVVYGDEFYQMARREKFKVFLAMLGELEEDKVSQLYARNKIAMSKMFQDLKTGGLQKIKKAHPGGPCIPGQKKIFVDVYGNFYPCEKISEYEQFQMGNLDAGFDIEKIQKLMNVGQYTENECLNCWAFLHCGTCAVGMIDGVDLSRKKRLRKCHETYSNTLGNMADIEVLKYYGYGFEDMN